MFDSPEYPKGRLLAPEEVTGSTMGSDGGSIPSKSYQDATASSSPGTSVGKGPESSSSKDKSTSSKLPHAGHAEPPRESNPHIVHSNMWSLYLHHTHSTLQFNGELRVIILRFQENGWQLYQRVTLRIL